LIPFVICESYEQALKTWIGKLPDKEKNDILFILIQNNPPHLGTELRMRFHKTLSNQGANSVTRKRRTVEQLLEAAETYAENRKRKIAE
jgi:hypothetical protein